jgi:hypothetical protein
MGQGIFDLACQLGTWGAGCLGDLCACVRITLFCYLREFFGSLFSVVDFSLRVRIVCVYTRECVIVNYFPSSFLLLLLRLFCD